MLKVMSFNIRYSLAEDGLNHWDKRKPLVIDRIRAFAPDLIGMQECRDDEQAEFIRTNLPEYHFYGVRRGGEDETALEMAPVIIRRGVFEIQEQGVFWLSETPDLAGSKSWDAHFARTVTWVKLTHNGSGKRMAFANTHFDYQPDAVLGGARLLADWAEYTQKEFAVIITGDFNADKDSPAYQFLTEGSHLRDAYRAANPCPEDETTFHAFCTSQERTSIDWVLVSGQFKVVHASIDRTHQGPLFPSDHYPVAIVLDWMS